MSRGGDDRVERADVARALDGVDRVELGGELGALLERDVSASARSKARASSRARVASQPLARSAARAGRPRRARAPRA